MFRLLAGKKLLAKWLNDNPAQEAILGPGYSVRDPAGEGAGREAYPAIGNPRIGWIRSRYNNNLRNSEGKTKLQEE